MISEKLLNAFLSSRLLAFGLKHINSEVPKVIESHEGNRPDILAYDLISKIPIILELKVVKSDTVIQQTIEYLELVSKKYPTLFEELEGFGVSEIPRFNYENGIVGMIVSPSEPPTNHESGNHTLVWAQFGVEADKIIGIKNVHVLNRSSQNASYFTRNQKVMPLLPDSLLGIKMPSLRAFANLLHQELMKIGTIYVRPKQDYKYAAYYGTDTLAKAVYGIASMNNSSFTMDYHVKAKNHKEFLRSIPVKSLIKLGYSFDNPRKDLIFQLPVHEEKIGKEQAHNELLRLFVGAAKISYDFERDPKIKDMIIDENSIGALGTEKVL